MKTNTNKLERIRERRNKVYFTIKFRGGNGSISFNSIVKNVNFQQLKKDRLSRNEIASHIAILMNQHKIGSNSGERKLFFHFPSYRDRMRSFNEMMYGCSNPVHIFGVGTINPNTREGKRFLDP